MSRSGLSDLSQLMHQSISVFNDNDIIEVVNIEVLLQNDEDWRLLEIDINEL